MEYQQYPGKNLEKTCKRILSFDFHKLAILQINSGKHNRRSLPLMIKFTTINKASNQFFYIECILRVNFHKTASNGAQLLNYSRLRMIAHLIRRVFMRILVGWTRILGREVPQNMGIITPPAFILGE